MKTFLIAGGAGFIGSHLCRRLLDDGHHVVCVDNLLTGSEDNIDHLKKNSHFEFIKEDIIATSFSSVIGHALSGIYHLASPASPSNKSKSSYMAHPVETLLVNSYGTYNLLELAKKNNSRFLFASTSEVYGDPEISPQSEDYFGNVNPNGIRSVYDEGKRFGESITMTYFRKYELDVRIARIFNTYGENMQRDDGRVISNFIIQSLDNSPITVYGDGLQTRSFCYISDMIEGLVSLMEKDYIPGSVVNLGNPDEYQILEIAKKVKELTASSSEIVFEDLPEDDPQQRKPDITRAQHMLGWGPKVDLATGVKKTIEWFRS